MSAGLFGLVVGWGALAHAAATTGTWKGGASGDWSTIGNWTGSVPGGGGDANISGVGSAMTINNDVDGLTLGGLYMPTGAGGTLTISGKPITFTSKSSGNNIAARFTLNVDSEVVLAEGTYPHVFAGLCNFNNVISGTGVFQLATDKPSVNLNAANTFTGGTVIPSGDLFVKHINGLGANAEGDAAPVTVNAGDANNRRLRFAVADGVFYHPITSTATTAGAAGTSMVNVHADENTTLKGKLSGGAFGFGNANGKTLVVDGEVDCGAYGLYLYPVGNGNIVVNGKVTASVVASSSGVNNADTQFVLANPENNIAKVSLQTRSFRAGAANVCTGAVWESTQDHRTKALWFLNGFDQSIDRILTDSNTAHAGLFVYSGDSEAATSKAATLRMKASADANISYCFQQHVSLVWDPQGPHTLTLRDRTHGTDGALEVKGGTLALTGATKMLNVTALTVGPGATCTIADAAEVPFAAKKVALTLAEDATLDVGEKPLTFASIMVGSTPLPSGSYTGNDNPNPGRATKLPQLRGTGVLAVAWTPQPSATASWIGGAGTDLTTDANWKGGQAPDFAAGNVLPTFSDAAATAFAAVVPQSMVLNGLVFTGESFTLSAQAGAMLTLGDQGIAVTAAAEQANERTYQVSAPLVIGTSQKWNTGSSAKNTLAVGGGLYAGGEPDAKLTVEGAGTLRLTGAADADFPGSVEVSGGVAYIDGEHPFGKAQNGAAGDVTIRGASTFAHFGGCKVDKALYLNAYSANNNIQIDPDAEVHFENQVVHQGPTRWEIGARAKVYFDGGFTKTSTSWQSVWWSDASGSEIFVRKTPIEFGCDRNDGGLNTAQFITSAGTWHFQVAHNKIRQLYVVIGTINCDVDWAIDCDKTVLQWREANSPGAFELNGHPARVGTFVSASDRGSVRNSSVTPAALYVNQSLCATNVSTSYTSTNKCNLVGNIDFFKRGAEELAFGRALAATGTVAVSEGRLVLTKDASWLGASEISVAADSDTAAGCEPVLEIASGRTFSRNAVLSLGTGATVAFHGTTPFVQSVKKMTVDGREVEPGVYTKANAPAGVTFVGAAGAIRVRGGGLVLVVR